MRADEADPIERHLLHGREAMADRLNRLRDDRKLVLVQEVMRLGDRPGERALDRQDTVVRLGAGDGTGDAAEAPERRGARRRGRVRPPLRRCESPRGRDR